MKNLIIIVSILVPCFSLMKIQGYGQSNANYNRLVENFKILRLRLIQSLLVVPERKY